MLRATSSISAPSLPVRFIRRLAGLFPSSCRFAGFSAGRQTITCAASTPGGHTRVAFLESAGLTAAATIAMAPAVTLADDGVVNPGEEVTTDSGLKYVVTAVGKGAKPNTGNTIKAHYTGGYV